MQDNEKEKMIETKLKYVHGGNAFPAYIAFHSYLVGVEMLCFREATNMLEYNGAYHGDIERVLRVTKGFQESLLNNMDLFDLRGKAIIDTAIKTVSRFS